MNIENMLDFLGVHTQSEESISLCYKMDLEAFKMMNDSNLDKEIIKYDAIYNYLLDELGYKKIDDKEKNNYFNIIKNIKLDEKDLIYRKEYFSGLERILLRYNYFNLIHIDENDNDPLSLAKYAYILEMNNKYDEAIKIYEKLNFNSRIKECKKKMK
jgi:hypothetical protein